MFISYLFKSRDFTFDKEVTFGNLNLLSVLPPMTTFSCSLVLNNRMSWNKSEADDTLFCVQRKQPGLGEMNT